MPAAVHTATLGSLLLKQILSSNLSWNGTPVELNASGAVDVSEYLGGPGELRATFESDDLGGVAAVSNFFTAGLSVSAGTITIPYQVRANNSTFATGGNHVAFSGTHGLIWPTNVNLPAGRDATASLECLFESSDGDTPPASINTSASLTGETPNGKWTLGPVSVNGIELSQVTGVTITTGIEVMPVSYLHNHPTEAFIVRRRPVIDITLYDLTESVATWVAGTACVVYARKRSGTSFATNITAAHVKFSFADGIIAPVQAIAGAGVGGNSTRTIRFLGETLTVAGSSAIT